MAKRIFAAAALLGLVGLAATANATPVPGPDQLTEGVYYGNGNGGTNFNWTITNGTLELGLQGLIRTVGPITPDGTVYQVSTGTAANGSQLWGFAYSAFDSAGFDNVALSISILDVGKNSTQSFQPLLVPDNGAIDGTPGDTSSDCLHSSAAACASPTGIQNAENPSFSFVDAGYNPWVADSYVITLTATDPSGNTQLGQVSITVNAVPEPVSLSLLGAGLVGMGVVRRRKKSAA
ncbi:MAG TPA: PEP-CTERM sorting domain-containing protein [Rhodopila sp.]|jgi:hypothetical protein|nr:PEP-CTERM sorting domain-containing protein [Rhodopila sp.]